MLSPWGWLEKLADVWLVIVFHPTPSMNAGGGARRHPIPWQHLLLALLERQP